MTDARKLTKLVADAALLREHIDALQTRVLHLESELASLRASATKTTRSSVAPAAPRPAGAGPSPVGPPPLPIVEVSKAVAAARKPVGRRSIVDISETAELIESIPPPPPRPTRR